MPIISKPYNYTNGNVIDAIQLDQNLDTLYNWANGGIDTTNIAANGISDPAKIAAEVITQAKSKGLIYTQDLYGQSWVVSGGVTTASGSPANQVTVTTLVANILQADGSYRHVSVAGSTYVTAIINATYYLELQPDGTMNWAQAHSIQSGYMPIATVTSDGSGNILLITDNRITDPKLKGALNSTIYSLEREVANLKAASTIANRVDGASGILYDLNDGLNGGSIGKIDLSSTNATGTITATGSSITVPVSGGTTGFAIGQEVTIFDGTNLERRNITSLVAGTSLTFAAMTNSYSAKARICRSSVIQDTVNKLLKFGGWTYNTTVSNTGVTVVASAYTTSGNGGKKFVILPNLNVVTLEMNGTTVQLQKTTDGGTTFNALCNISGMNAAAIDNFGNICTVLAVTATTVYSVTFDATTVTNIDLNSTKVTIDSAMTSVNVNISLATGADGLPQAVYYGIHPTFPNSNNYRYAKATTTSVTAWGAVVQVTSDNTTGTDSINTTIKIKSNNNAVIIGTKTTASGITVQSFYYNGASFVAATTNPYPQLATYTQSLPSSIIKANGSNIGRIFACWYGKDATDSSFTNIHVAYSDDGGINYTVIGKITSGNTVNRITPMLSEDNLGNIYAIYNDNGSVVYQKCSDGTTTFSGLTTIDVTGTSPSTLERGTFTSPPTIYVSGSVIKYTGTLNTLATTQVLVEDVRYNISPPANVGNAVAWVDHDADANYSIAGALSLQAGGGNESFANMTKTTAAIDGTHNEDQFTGSGTAAAKATLRLTLTRNSTSLVKNIESIMGAVGA